MPVSARLASVLLFLGCLAATPGFASQTWDDSEPIATAVRGRTLEPGISRASVSRVFFNGDLNWIWQASTLGSLSMRGHGTSATGGTIQSVTACLYNESSFSRTFRVTAEVRQAGSSIQRITFSSSFPSSRFTCHTVSSFAAVVAAGNFEIVVSYDRSFGDNFWAGLAATDSGDVFDVQIGGARPPFASGPQGPLQMKGVGIRYRIDETELPPPPPCPAPCLNGRFSVRATYALQNGNSGTMGHNVLSANNAAFYFQDNTNLELFVKMLNACGANGTYWVFASGLTNQGIEVTIEDSLSDRTLTISNPLGRLFPSFVSTTANSGAFPCATD